MACPFFLIFPNLSFHLSFSFSKVSVDSTNYSSTYTYLLCAAIGRKAAFKLNIRPFRIYFLSASPGFLKFALAENHSEARASSSVLTLAYEIEFWFILSS